MSLILEALRKSEAERLRGRAPDLHAALSLPRSTPRPVRRRGISAAVLLLAGIAAMAWIWRDRIVPADAMPQPQPAIVTPPANITAPAAEAHLEMPRATMADARRTAQAAAPSNASPPTAPPRASTPPAVTRTAAEVAVTVPEQAPEATGIADSEPARLSQNESSLRRLGDLDSTTRAQLPALKVSMHVWNHDPRQRFALIDGQRLGEGAQIGEAVIERISREGVVLAWRGEHLLLARP